MTFDEAKKLPDKAVLDEIEGRVVRVGEPKAPTEGQHRVGIHKQSITLQDDSGDEIALELLQKEIHLLPSYESKIMKFRSVGDQGLSMNRWVGDKGDEFITLQADRKCHFYVVEEKPEARAAYEATKPQIGDLIGFYCTIMQGIETTLAGSEVLAAMLQHPESLASATATVFIEGCKQGMWKKGPTPAPEVKSLAMPPKEAAPPVTKEPEKVNGAEQCHATPGELADMICIGANSNIVRDFCNNIDPQPDFPHVYDIVVENLEKEGYARRDIDMAHDRVKKLIQQKTDKPLNDAVLYKSICFNFDGFRKQLELLVPKKPATEPKERGLDDDNELPSLDD